MNHKDATAPEESTSQPSSNPTRSDIADLSTVKSLTNHHQDHTLRSPIERAELLATDAQSQPTGQRKLNARFLITLTVVLLVGPTAVALTPSAQDSHGNNASPMGLHPSVKDKSCQQCLVDMSGRLALAHRWAENLKSSAAKAFDNLRGTKYAAYAWVTQHLDVTTGEVQYAHVNLEPFLFVASSDTWRANRVIETQFRGGCAAFFEVLLSTRLAAEARFLSRNLACADRHDIILRSYDDILKVTNVTANRLSQLFATFDYADTVLDCCLGSGALARFAIDAGVPAKFTAIELSPKMAELPDC